LANPEKLDVYLDQAFLKRLAKALTEDRGVDPKARQYAASCVESLNNMLKTSNVPGRNLMRRRVSTTRLTVNLV
jgi:arsenate reductase-like glutaredoxin family protein